MPTEAGKRPVSPGRSFDNLNGTASYPPPTDGQRLYRVRDLAGLLDVSATTVYRLVESRSIAFIRLPRGLRFRQSDIDAFLAGRTVDAVE